MFSFATRVEQARSGSSESSEADDELEDVEEEEDADEHEDETLSFSLLHLDLQPHMHSRKILSWHLWDVVHALAHVRIITKTW